MKYGKKMKSSPGQARMAKGIAGVVKTFVDTKSHLKKRK